jgi:hypothetical protein
MLLARRAPLLLASLALAHCGGTNGTGSHPLDPNTAPVVSVDRFSDSFGKLFKRSAPAFDPTNVSKIVPAPNAPIDFDQYFTVRSWGPTGQKVSYYSLDILPAAPVKGYVLVSSTGQAIASQLPIIESIPGDADYNDFVQIVQVQVNADYVANTITSLDDVNAAVAAGTATMNATTRIANWGVVPKGSTATMKFSGQPVSGFQAWYKHQVAYYLKFETNLAMTGDGKVPTSGISVIFKDGMSPAMGFAAEMNGMTHNALQTLPGDPGYSSLWSHQMGKLAGFDTVKDWPTAVANYGGPLPVLVNCPVVAP